MSSLLSARLSRARTSLGRACALGALCAWAAPFPAGASGSQAGRRVLALASDASPAHLELLAAYGEARQVPRGNRCVLQGLADAAADVEARVLSAEDYEALVLAPVQACLHAADDPAAVDFIVTLRGLPHHVRGEGWQASLEALLGVGSTTVGGEALWRRPEAVADRPMVLNPNYAAFAAYDLVTELRAGRFPPAPRHADGGPAEALLVTAEGVRGQGPATWDLRPAHRLDGGSHEGTLALIERSIESDGTAPAGVWLCMEGADVARGVRDRECGRALTLLEGMGMAVAQSPWDPALTWGEPVMAYLTGAADLRGAIAGLDYRPGALADNVTSFGAVPANWSYAVDGESQTSVVRFLEAGASATHGTSAEPLNGAFASAGLMVLYAQGYTLGEAYALSLPYLRWMNVTIGDPLMAPYAELPPVREPDPDSDPDSDPEPDPDPDPDPDPELDPDPDPAPERRPTSDPQLAPAPDPALGADGVGRGEGGGCRVAEGLLPVVLRR